LKELDFHSDKEIEFRQNSQRTEGNIDVCELVFLATSGIYGARRDADPIPNERTYSTGKMHKHVPEIDFYSKFNARLSSTLWN